MSRRSHPNPETTQRQSEGHQRLHHAQNQAVAGFDRGTKVALKKAPTVCIGALIAKPGLRNKVAVVRPLTGGDSRPYDLHLLVVWQEPGA